MIITYKAEVEAFAAVLSISWKPIYFLIFFNGCIDTCLVFTEMQYVFTIVAGISEYINDFICFIYTVWPNPNKIYSFLSSELAIFVLYPFLHSSTSESPQWSADIVGSRIIITKEQPKTQINRTQRRCL